MLLVLLFVIELVCFASAAAGFVATANAVVVVVAVAVAGETLASSSLAGQPACLPAIHCCCSHLCMSNISKCTCLVQMAVDSRGAW